MKCAAWQLELILCGRAYLKITKGDLKISYREKKNLKLCMGTEVNGTYCGEYFTIYTNYYVYT